MTSNGNQAQKILIQALTETHPEPLKAYKIAIQRTKTPEQADTIKRIYNKLKQLNK